MEVRGGLIAKSCPTLGTPWTLPARLLCPWDFSGKNTGVGCYFLFQGIFPTQWSNPCLLHCRLLLNIPQCIGQATNNSLKCQECHSWQSSCSSYPFVMVRGLRPLKGHIVSSYRALSLLIAHLDHSFPSLLFPAALDPVHCLDGSKLSFNLYNMKLKLFWQFGVLYKDNVSFYLKLKVTSIYKNSCVLFFFFWMGKAIVTEDYSIICICPIAGNKWLN